jgi:cyclohexanecarboxyl-CoA dehydrogenase
MSGFGFTEAQEMLRQEVRNFAQKELAPGALARSKMEPMELHENLHDIDKKCVELGWNHLNVPEKYGGHQIDHVSLGIIVEEVAKVDPTVEPVGSIQATSALLTQLPEDMQDYWFPPLIKREKRHSFGFTESAAGSDAAGIVTRAVREGDHYIVNGEKTPLPGATVADAVTISVKTDPKAGFRGVSLLWIPTNTPGVTIRPLPWMGNAGLFPSFVTFDDVRVPVRNRIGEEGMGFYLLMGTLDWLRIIVALHCLARAQASLADAMLWAKERKTFGKLIASYEGVSFVIAEHYTFVEAARMLCYRTLYLKDQGQMHTMESAMAKWFSVEVSVQCIKDCMVLLGHPGYSTEHPISMRLRDVIGYQLGDGPPQIQKLIIARLLLGKALAG